ncbi:MAG: SDR family NAD(P)-dependent oxidoreductase, partial [Geminicoccaceae bacterium]
MREVSRVLGFGAAKLLGHGAKCSAVSGVRARQISGTAGVTNSDDRLGSETRLEDAMLDLGLEGKVALITGGSDGLGRAAAARLAAEGARVAICARRRPQLEAAAAELRAQSGG